MELSASRAFGIEYGAAFFGISCITIIVLLTSLQESVIWVRLALGFPVVLVLRSMIYAQFIEKREGVGIGLIDAFMLAAALAAVAVVISLIPMLVAVAAFSVR